MTAEIVLYSLAAFAAGMVLGYAIASRKNDTEEEVKEPEKKPANNDISGKPAETLAGSSIDEEEHIKSMLKYSNVITEEKYDEPVEEDSTKAIRLISKEEFDSPDDCEGIYLLYFENDDTFFTSDGAEIDHIEELTGSELSRIRFTASPNQLVTYVKNDILEEKYRITKARTNDGEPMSFVDYEFDQ